MLRTAGDADYNDVHAVITTPYEYGSVGAIDQQLGELLGSRFVTSIAARNAHGRGEGLSDVRSPDAVAYAETTAEVARIVALCAQHRVPIIPFGAGTSLEGQLQALRGGISLDLSHMNRVLTVSAADLDCRLEAGVTRESLNSYVRDQGLFFPLDPGANATLGGMAATRASGTNAVRYGTMREVTLGLTVVTPSGAVIKTGGRARKSSAGYDLTRLYVGSEGTLGVITELQLRLFGVPETIVAATCQFPTLEEAVRTVTTVLQLGVPIARIELLDELQMSASISYSKLTGYEELPTLFLELHGSPITVEEQVSQVREIVADAGGAPLRCAGTPEERRLWEARHNAYWAARSLKPGTEAFATDACVPISELASCIGRTKAAAVESRLTCPIVGHVGDGNFHVLVLFNAADVGERDRAEALVGKISDYALAHGGTISGEHGVGVHKLGYMYAEHGSAIAVMQALKQALDPLNIMNPGKTVPSPTVAL